MFTFSNIVYIILIYIVYSCFWLVILINLEIPDNYKKIKELMPNRKKRFLFFLISGLIFQSVMFFSFINYKLNKHNLNKFLDYFKK
jgi:hypothetical protein